MENEVLGQFKEKFTNLLSDPEYVYVEKFYKPMEEKNKLLSWNDKILPEFTPLKNLVINCDPKEFELLVEGFRCLCQIHINLLKDFQIFKRESIRKYSSAYDYISKIEDFKTLLSKIGYVENNDQMIYQLKKELDELEDRDYSVKTCLTLLILFMEVNELIKLRYDRCNAEDLLIQRESNIKDNITNEKDNNMSNEDKLNQFRTCEVCDGNMDLDKGSCEICEFSVIDFAKAAKFKDFIRTQFNLIVPVTPKTPDFPSIDERRGSLKSTPKRSPIPNHRNKPENDTKTTERNTKKNGKDDKDQWACTKCTFLNSNDNFNCIICETTKQ